VYWDAIVVAFATRLDGADDDLRESDEKAGTWHNVDPGITHGGAAGQTLIDEVFTMVT
jgi:hypothetical protein